MLTADTDVNVWPRFVSFEPQPLNQFPARITAM